MIEGSKGCSVARRKKINDLASLIPLPGVTMTAWRMAFRAGNNGHEMWPDCYRLGVAAIEYGPVDDIDLSAYAEGEPKAAWSQLKQTQKASLKRLVDEMQEGDVIYVKEGPMIVGKGVVTGPYQFDKHGRIQEPNGAFWQHQRSVAWVSEFPTVRVQLGRSQRLTVESLADEDVSRIERIVGPPRLMAEEADEGEVNDDVGYIAQDGDRREMIWQQIKKRRGQKQFRDALLERYKGRCLVTHCEIMDVLEAAHIDPYRGEDENHPENGLLLRADIHTLFDLDLLGIEPDSLRVELHPNIAGHYGDLIGATLACDGTCRPSKEALARRHEQFQKLAELVSSCPIGPVLRRRKPVRPSDS
jgi:hypothetical protein